MTPRRRTAILAALSFGTALVLAPAVYLGYEWTIGGVWSHNQSLDRCARTPNTERGRLANRSEISATDRWTWWPPGHAHRCVYLTPNGRTVVRPVPK